MSLFVLKQARKVLDLQNRTYVCTFTAWNCAWNTLVQFGNLSGSKKDRGHPSLKRSVNWMTELKLKQVVCLLVQRLASSCPDICLACVKYACLRLVGTVLIDPRDGVPSNKTALIRETSTHTFWGKALKQSSSILCYFKSKNLQNWAEATIILRFGWITFTPRASSFFFNWKTCKISSLRAKKGSLLVQKKSYF